MRNAGPNPHEISPLPPLDADRIQKAAARLGLMGRSAEQKSRIMTALCDPATPAADLAALIRTDPTLCARVLRVANSAYYGHSHRVSSIERGLIMLGRDAVRGIAAAACLQGALPRGSRFARVDTLEFLHHSIASAEAASILARSKRPGLESESWIAGLLHNLGTIILMQLDWPGAGLLLDSRERGDTRHIAALESEILSTGHEACLALVFEAWHMPGAVIAAAGHHHDPMAAPMPHRDLVTLVNLGACIALKAGYTFAFEPCGVDYAGAAMHWLDLVPEELDGIASLLPAQVQARMAALLDA